MSRVTVRVDGSTEVGKDNSQSDVAAGIVLPRDWFCPGSAALFLPFAFRELKRAAVERGAAGSEHGGRSFCYCTQNSKTLKQFIRK